VTLSNISLTPKKDLAAKLLAQGYTQAEVARDERIAVTKQTMNNWYKDDNFQERIEEHKTDPVKGAEEIFARAVGEAADAIVQIAVGRPTNTIIKEGEEVEIPIDHRFIASKLKAALFVIERVVGKKSPLEVTKPKEEELDETSNISEDEMDEVLEYID
jgi:hypothetical protein